MTTPDAVEALFQAVRAACAPARWSRGVELHRAGAVVSESIDEEEAVFRIGGRGGLLATTVKLFPDDAEWECPCGFHEDVCEHVAAAAIAWRRAERDGLALASPDSAGAVGYRFELQVGGLALLREIVKDDESFPLETTLTAAAAGKAEVPEFLATQEDIAVELAMGTYRRGPVPRGLIEPLFARLARCRRIRLAGQPVRIDARPLLPRIRVADQGDGFRVTLVDDPELDQVYDNGIARCGQILRPVGESKLSGRELHELPRGLRFSPDQAGELVTEVLPRLRRSLPVDVETRRLPETVREAPRIRLDVERRDERLEVFATLVYGDPPRARVDGGRLVPLGSGPVPLRDEAGERRLLQRLQRELDMVPGVRETHDGERAVAFRAKLEGWESAVRGSGHDYFRVVAPLEPHVRIGPEQFDVSFTSAGRPAGGGSANAGQAAPGAVLRAWREGASLVPLLGGGWAPIPREWLERFGPRIEELLEARDPQGRVPRCVSPDLAALADELDQPPPPELAQLRQALTDFDGIPTLPLPSDLRAELRSYQQRGVDWLRWMRGARLGALLADDMGLGKTLQALCAIEGRTLVVAPTSVLHNWQDEASRFRPSLRCAVYHGPARQIDPAADLTLTTYAILRLDADRLAAESWDTVVLDEAQAIKNPESQVAAAAFRLQSDCRITLTGTPVENRLDELWSQFHFLNRGLLGGRKYFQQRYAGPVAAGEPGAAARLRERIRPFVLRRLKDDVAADLPPRTDVVLRCELSPAEREVYDTIRAATRSEVVAKLEAGGNVLAALEALLRLRQAACHAGLVPGHEAAGSAKLALLLESLDSVVAEGRRALVFSQWTSLLDLTEPHLRSAGIGFVRLDGSTRDRAAVVRTFQGADGPPVLLVSLKAGGAGLNLTAADHVFLLDLWWNPAVEEQAADRAHRIGQDRPVMVYRLVAEDTVEERILTLQQTKRALADVALGDAEQAASLTRDDLLELLR